MSETKLPETTGANPGDEPKPTPGTKVPGTAGTQRRLLVAAIGAIVLLGAVMVGVALRDDDETSTGPPAPTTEVTQPSTTAPTTSSPTTEAPTTTAATAPAVVDTSTAVFPFASSSVRFGDPVSAATAFATDYLGIENPDVGTFMQGDSRSGEVLVDGMTVFVRQLGADGTWWVLGSADPGATIDTPAAGERISSPVTVTGQARGWERRIVVEVRQDGSAQSVGITYGMAGFDQLEPFEEQVDFSADESYGAVVVYGANGQGVSSSASVVRVRFG